MIPDHPERALQQQELERDIEPALAALGAEHDAVHRRCMRALHRQGLLPEDSNLDWDHLREVILPGARGITGCRSVQVLRGICNGGRLMHWEMATLIRQL
jgi:hypothetical protein